ncbi:MAG: V-type ATP synthase subunit E [Chloroflexota bacterium]
MKGMEKISAAVLDKVKAEAKEIIKEAEAKAKQEIESAKEQQAQRLAEEKARITGEAEREAAKILAQAHIEAQQQLSRAKADVISGLIDRVKSNLPQSSASEGSLLGLIREVVDGLGDEEAVIYLNPRDVSIAKKALAGDKALAGRVAEIREFAGVGGAIAENVGGNVRMDNSYESRLEVLLPRMLPEVGKELF